MSRKCELTNKKPMSGNNRSKALNATKRKWNVNLQQITIDVNGQKKKIKVSSKAIKTLKKKGKI